MSQYIRLVIAVFSLACSTLLAAQTSVDGPDYAREARWATEVVPNLVIGDAIQISADARNFLGLFTPGNPQLAESKPAIVLIHGVGVHPDFGLIGQLRTRLSDLGYATLSIQMPVLNKEVTDASLYAKTFPIATLRIRAAHDWLATKLKRPVVLLSHSMGSWMSNVYFENTAQSPFKAWVCLSITGRIGSMGGNVLPIFDVQAENDITPVKRGSFFRGITLLSHSQSKRLEVPQTDHQYTAKEAQLAEQIGLFITEFSVKK